MWYDQISFNRCWLNARSVLGTVSVLRTRESRDKGGLYSTLRHVFCEDRWNKEMVNIISLCSKCCEQKETGQCQRGAEWQEWRGYFILDQMAGLGSPWGGEIGLCWNPGWRLGQLCQDRRTGFPGQSERKERPSLGLGLVGTAVWGGGRTGGVTVLLPWCETSGGATGGCKWRSDMT